ncbi:MAG TPA: hypothetical protein VMU89_13430 [Thermomicrobiaceae bacterium]|nr:hypothetical protein [Thermomicrobiaceae bacterium]
MTARGLERIALLALEVFGAVSAIGGGIALLVGTIDLPAEWLVGSPFGSYTGPALVLALATGGSQLVALAAELRHEPWATLASGFAGCVMMGWIVGELILVGSEPGIMRNLQLTMFLTGLLEAGLASLQLRAHAATS